MTRHESTTWQSEVASLTWRLTWQVEREGADGRRKMRLSSLFVRGRWAGGAAVEAGALAGGWPEDDWRAVEQPVGGGVAGGSLRGSRRAAGCLGGLQPCLDCGLSCGAAGGGRGCWLPGGAAGSSGATSGRLQGGGGQRQPPAEAAKAGCSKLQFQLDGSGTAGLWWWVGGEARPPEGSETSDDGWPTSGCVPAARKGWEGSPTQVRSGGEGAGQRGSRRIDKSPRLREDHGEEDEGRSKEGSDLAMIRRRFAREKGCNGGGKEEERRKKEEEEAQEVTGSYPEKTQQGT